MAVSAFRTVLGSALFCTLFGCGTASNSAWLREPEAGMSLGSDLAAPLEQQHASSASETSLAASPLVEHPLIPGASESAEARPRLARTVTLGGPTVANETRPESAGAAPGGAPVQIVINNYVTAPAYDAVPAYAPYYAPVIAEHAGGGRFDGNRDRGRFDGDRGQRPASKPSSPNIVPGQDFPAPRSFGPSFPYKTAPASPWK